MKKIITILSIYLSMTFLNGQDIPFPQDSASWTYLIRMIDGGYEYPPTTRTLVLHGDSIINGKQYKKITPTSHCDGGNLGGSHSYIREENGKVYYLYNTEGEEILLYDFTLELGDTMFTKNCHNNYEDTLLIVNDITQTLINGAYRKTLVFQNFTSRWIEGIGNIDAFLITPEYYINFVLLDPSWYTLLCFSENGEQIIADTFHYYIAPETPDDPGTSIYYSCNGIITDISEPPIENGLIITPNPTTSFFDISLKIEGESIHHLRLYDLMGRELLNEEYPRLPSVKVQTADWSPGLYIVIVNDRWVEKVVVE